MLLPGPEAQQLAIYIGWLLHRTAGGIMAGVLFIVPGVIAIMGLSYIYAAFGHIGDDEIPTELGIDVLGMLGERLGGRRHLERRPPALERHLHGGVGDQLVLDTLAHLALEAVIVGDAQHAHVGRRRSDRRDDVAVGAGAGDRFDAPAHKARCVRAPARCRRATPGPSRSGRPPRCRRS